MVQLFCKLCLQATPWVHWPHHIAQKHHLLQLPLKIVVKGPFQDKTDEVYAYFGKFGRIRNQNVSVEGDLTAIEYRFWDPRVYSEIIHTEHHILGDVEISWYKKSQKGPVEYVVQDERMQNEKFIYRKLAIINEIKNPPTFLEQLAVLLDRLTTIQDEMELRRASINADLTSVLRQSFPNSKVYFFGSSTMNLDLYNSDVNIYLDNTDSTEAALHNIKELITACDFFLDVSVVAKSDTSILRCQHKQSKVRCELSIRSEMPIARTELVVLYLSLNEKLRDLLLVVRFWADCHQLGLSGYALNLLVIFYLQQGPYNLPSVFDLQKDIPPDEIDGWNCAFAPVEYEESALKNTTLLELLTGFFQFYGNFDYISNVVCVFSGCGVDKTKFVKPYSLQNCFETYLNQEKEFPVTAGLCLQDPFEHSENVTSSAPVATMGRLAAACRMSVELTLSEKELLYQLVLFPDSNTVSLKVEHDIKTVVLNILTDVCNCEVTETGNVFHCKSDCTFWGSRAEAAKNLTRDSHTSDLDHEAAITTLLKNAPRCEDTPWDMELCLKLQKGSRVIIEFSSSEKLSELPHIQHFIYLRLMAALSDKVSITTSTYRDIKQEMNLSQKEPKVEVIEDQDDLISSSQIKMEVSVDLCDDDDDVQCIVDVNPPGTSQMVSAVWPDFQALKATIASGAKNIPFQDQMLFFQREILQASAQIESIKHLIEPDLVSALGLSDSKCIYYDAVIVTNNLRISIEENRTPQDIQDLLLSSGKFVSVSLEGTTVIFVHAVTETTCELIIRSGIDRRTNLFVQYYMSLDAKVQSLMVLAHFWAARCRLDTLRIDLLVIFFLQQEPYKLPCVKDLQTDALPELVEGYNCRFMQLEHQSSALQITNDLTLVRGFFDFYQEFDYSSYIISLYLGTSVPKVSVDHIPDLDTFMCLQHPFQHSHCLPVSLELLRDFVTFCKVAVDLAATSENELLYQLLTYNNIDDTWAFSICKDPDEDPLEWITSIKSVFYTVFIDVFGCEVTETSEDTHKCRYRLSGSTSVFNNRVGVAKMLELSSDVTELDKEIAVSQYILDNLQTTESPWRITIRIDFDSDSSRVAVGFISDNGLNVDYYLSVTLRKFWALKRRMVKVEPEGEEESEVEIVGSLSDTDTGIFAQVPDAAPIPEKISALSAALQGDPSQILETVSNDLRTLLLTSEIFLAASAFPELNLPRSWYDFHLDSKAVDHPTLLTLTEAILSQSEKFHEISLGATSLMCRHVETQAVCCLVARSQIATASKTLIAQHLYLNQEVVALMTVVKFWVRRCGLVDFDGYCIYLLVIFYLQRGQTSSLFGLLRGFFAFYGSFDYLTYLVSPHLGPAHEKSKPKTHGAGICIQDAADSFLAISMESSGKFSALCRSATEALTVDSSLSFVQHPYCHSFVELKNDGKSDNNFRMCVEMYTFHILRKVLGCHVKKSGVVRVKFDTLIEDSKVQVTLVFKKGGCQVKLSGDKASLHVLHAVHVNLEKLLKREVFSLDVSGEEVNETRQSQSKLAAFLDNIRLGDNFNSQASILLDCLQVSPTESKLTEEALKKDLGSILTSSTIFFAPRLSKLEPLEIFIERSDAALEEIKLLLSQSAAFDQLALTSGTITCKHVETDLICHLQISGKFSLLNCEVMRKCSILNGVRSLMVIAKFWADCHELCGFGGFCKEAIYMLVIFFLQRKDYKLLPVVKMQEFHYLVNEQLEDPELFPLVCGFFEYYADFDYFSFVVSPFCGSSVRKSRFLKPYELQDFEAYTKQSEDLPVDSSICVQDFFDHARNVAAVGCSLSGRFVTLCRTSAQVLTSTEQLLPALVNSQNISSCSLNKVGSIPINIPAKIFKDVFNCTVKCTPSVKTLTYHCTGTHDIWDMRTVVEKTLTPLPPNGAVREAAITARLVTDYPQPSPWSIVIKFIFTSEDTQIECSNSDLCEHFCHFVKTKLLKSLSGKVRHAEKSAEFSYEVTSLLAAQAAKTNQVSQLACIRRGFPKQYSVYCHDPTGLPCDVLVRVQNAEEFQKAVASINRNFRGRTAVSGDQFRYVHRKTHLSLVLTPNEDYTTSLLKYYLGLDDKINKTIATIKMWASRHNFTKHFYGSAVSLMVIFFLQHEFNIPSVMDLQKDTPEKVEGGWNCAFAMKKFGSPLRDTSILELIQGFFKFYGDFDCFSYVVAPYVGSAVAKTRFLQPFALPESYKAYCQKGQEISVDAGLCVQHPFVHTRNVTEEVSYDEAARFACYCRHSLLIMARPKLFSMVNVLRWNKDLVTTQFTLSRSKNEPHEQWAGYIRQLFWSFSKGVLNCYVNKRNTQWHCKGNYEVLVGRVSALKALLRDLPRNTNGLEKEIAVTARMVKVENEWRFSIIPSFKSWKVVFMQRQLEKQKSYRFCHFMYTRLRKFVNDKDRISPSLISSGAKRSSEDVDVSQEKRIKLDGPEPSTSKVTVRETKTRRLVPTDFNHVKSLAKSAQNKPTVNAQFDYFVEKLFASKPLLNSRLKLVRDQLEAVLPPCELHPVGSAVTETFYWESGFDFYVSLGNTPVYLLQKRLKQSRQFTDIEVTENILRCKHKASKTWCILYVEEKFRLRHTQMMRCYMSLNPILQPFFCLIKLWFGFNELKNYPCFLTPYILDLLLVFYLQQEPYKMPSVARLQDAEFHSPELEWATLLELIFGFFEFYSKFDYYSYVISPFSGTAIEKTSFLPPFDGLPNCYNESSTPVPLDSSLCVQDPFEHHRNATSSMNLQSLDMLALTFRKGAFCKGLSPLQIPYRLLVHCRSIWTKQTFVIPRGRFHNNDEWLETTKKIFFDILTKTMFCKITNIEQRTLSGKTDVAVNIRGKMRPYVCRDRVSILKRCQQGLSADATTFEKDVAIAKYLKQKSERRGMGELKASMVFMVESGLLSVWVNVPFGTRHFIYTRMLMGLEDEKRRTSALPQTSIEATPPPPLEVHFAEQSSPTVPIDTTRPLPTDPSGPLPSDDEADHQVYFSPASSDHDDIPSDFFDDFANEDFLEGLNIVDAWDETAEKEPGPSSGTTDEGGSRRKRHLREDGNIDRERDEERPGSHRYGVRSRSRESARIRSRSRERKSRRRSWSRESSPRSRSRDRKSRRRSWSRESSPPSSRSRSPNVTRSRESHSRHRRPLVPRQPVRFKLRPGKTTAATKIAQPVPPPPPVISVPGPPTVTPPVNVFDLKQMSLSDFLLSKARKEAPRNDPKTRQKVQVIARCQSAIGILSGKTAGKLVVVPSSERKERQSPLRSRCVIRFHFTSLSHQHTGAFSDCLTSLVRRVGVGLTSRVEETLDLQQSVS